MKSLNSLTPMVFGVVAIVATPFQSAQALNATEVGVIAEAVTVRIDGQNPGSGVIIKRKANVYTVLTAAHVVATEDGYDVVTPDGQFHDLDYSKVKKLPSVDLALVEFTSQKNYKVADIGDSKVVKAGESIYVSGFPSPTAAITESIWNFSDGRVKANSNRPLADGYGLVYSNDTLPGMSGGAVLNSQGKLIAIHGRADAEQSVQKTEMIFKKTGFNLGIPINTFLNLAANVSPSLGFIERATEATGTALKADDWYLQATDKYKKRDYQNAIKDFGQAIALNPNYHESYMARGISYFQLKQTSQTIKDFDRVIALEPNLLEGYAGRGMTYFYLEQYSQAIKDFDRVIALEPKYVDAYKVRGVSYLKLKQYPQAIKDFDRVVTLDPKFPEIYMGRGLSYVHLKQYPQAIKDFDRVIALEPNNLVAYKERGISYLDLKQYPKAIKNFDQVIALEPKYAEAYQWRGLSYIKIGKKNRAKQDLQKAAQLYKQQNNQRGVKSVIKWLKQL